MKKFLSDNKRYLKDIIIISIIFLLTNWFMLVLTGTWWDEKTWAFSSTAEKWDISLQLGRPIDFFLQVFIFKIPEVVARIIIFICYYCITIGTYFIYNQIAFFDESHAFLATIIFVAIPANDAKVMRGVFPYTVGCFLFIVAFCELILLQKKYKYNNIPLRILTIALFLGSFLLNSNLVFYGVPCLYIFRYIIVNGQIRTFYKWFDFAIAPLVFFGVKICFFPAYGLYEGYNEVTVDRIIFGMIRTINTCVGRLIDILANWFEFVNIALLFIGIVLLIVVFIYESGAEKFKMILIQKPNVISMKYRIILLLIGLIAMYLGAFAYVVTGKYCSLNGVDGRSSILLPFGAALIIYAVVLWVPSKCIEIILCIAIVLCGFLHFNSYYLSYQQDYYRQQDLVYELNENRDVLFDTKNIIYLSSFEPKVGATRFYTLNSNGREAFGDESHLIMNGIGDYDYFLRISEEAWNLFVNQGDYQMDDYKIGKSSDIEAIIVYERNLSRKDTLMLKIMEIFNCKTFKDKLYGENNLTVYTPEMNEFRDILLQQGYSF